MKTVSLILLLNLLLVSCAAPIPGIFSISPEWACSPRTELIQEEKLKNIATNENFSDCKSLGRFKCGSYNGIQVDEIIRMKSFAFQKNANGLAYTVIETTAQDSINSKPQKYWIAEGKIYSCPSRVKGH